MTRTRAASIPRTPWRLVLAGLSLLLVAGPWGFAQETPPAVEPPPVTPAEPEPALPKLDHLPIPPVEELLNGKPVDWLVLQNQDVIFIEPVKPRPGTLEARKLEFETELKRFAPESELPAKLARLEELKRLPVTLLDRSEDPEYLIETRFIKEILHFETLILRRIALELDAGNLRPAYELLLFVERRHPNWPGARDQTLRFLLLEGNQFVAQGDFERALVNGEQLFKLQPDYPDLSLMNGRAVDGALTQAVAADDYRRARHFLARLKRLHPEHEVAARWTDRLSTQARATVEEARTAQRDGQHRDAFLLIERATRIWPDLPNLKDAHRELIDRHQWVRVGQLADGPKSGNYPFRTMTEDRRHALTSLPLFEAERVRDGTVRYRSRFVESWEPRQLGREVHVRLIERRAEWESRPVITSGAILRALARRITPDSADYDARWERDLVRLSANSPTEFTLTLSRIPLRIESRLRFSLPLDPNEPSDELLPAAYESPAQQRFMLSSRSPESTHFVRSRPQRPSPEGWHVAEVSEQAYPDWDALRRAMLRGELDLLPWTEWADLPALSADKRFLVQPLALPRTHLLQLHPQSPLATNASLRRALLHALPRERLLAETLLQGAPLTYGRLSTGPFPSVLTAYHSQLRQPDYDPLRAASLAATTRKQRPEGLPALRLSVPGDPLTNRVVPELIAAWKRVGLTVEVVGPEDRGPWDLAYRTLQIQEPIEELWELLHPSGSTDWNELAVYPHWLRERLWELEQTVDWPTAIRLLHQIQAEFLTEARWIPLWEVDDYLTIRRRFLNLPARPMHPYHDVERWTLQSWFPTETP